MGEMIDNDHPFLTVLGFFFLLFLLTSLILWVDKKMGITDY